MRTARVKEVHVQKWGTGVFARLRVTKDVPREPETSHWTCPHAVSSTHTRLEVNAVLRKWTTRTVLAVNDIERAEQQWLGEHGAQELDGLCNCYSVRGNAGSQWSIDAHLVWLYDWITASARSSIGLAIVHGRTNQPGPGRRSLPSCAPSPNPSLGCGRTVDSMRTKYLFFFAQAHDEFRIPELQSLAELFGFAVRIADETPDPTRPFMIIELDEARHAEQLAARSILIRCAFPSGISEVGK